MNTRRHWLQRTALAALTAFAWQAPAAHAQQNVTRILVPFAAGGATDIVARMVAQKLADAWGTPVVVDNKPGAAGTIASRQLVGSAPDGRTLIMVTSGHAINELIHTKLPYSTLKDFTPILQVTEISNVLLTTKDSPYKTVADVLAAGKAQPDSLSYGTAGVGTSVHLAGELLSAMTGVKLTPVHFKGDSESITNLAGGHIPLSINTIPGAKSQIVADKVRPLAVTTSARFPAFKDVPTLAESGVANYAVGNWFGVLGPAGMDAETVKRLNADFRRALTDPAIEQRLQDAGMAVKVGTPAEFDALIRGDIDKWRPIINKLGLKAGG